MATIQLSEDEIHSIIQALQYECDQYEKSFGSNSLNILREVSNRVIDRNEKLIEKLEEMIELSVLI
jgi:hypothetical protein